MQTTLEELKDFNATRRKFRVRKKKEKRKKKKRKKERKKKKEINL